MKHAAKTVAAHTFVVSPLIAQEGIVAVDSLSLQRAVALALEHHPLLQAAQANLNSGGAAKKVALSSYYDFGKTSSRVGANTDFVEATEEDFRSAHDNVAMNVQIAYFGFLQARSVVTVNEEAVQQAASPALK